MLVIIGLLIGGVFVGQSLIHNAQLNAVIQEYERYQTAVQSFNQTYNALPGDMTTATQIWGVAGGTGSDATFAAVSSTTSATCNGNGDGQILTNGSVCEMARFWQHLANAKVIEGQYPGVWTGGDGCTGGGLTTPGGNIPASRYAPAGWSVTTASQFLTNAIVASANTFVSADYGVNHVLVLGANSGWMADNPVMSPKDAWAIDKKIDDGKPGQGNIMIAKTLASCTTAASNTDLSASYRLSDTSKDCSLVFLTNF